MHLFSSIRPLRDYLWEQRLAGKTIGLVPTMGALHQGHLSLIEASQQQDDLTVCSIFVNPIQFTNPDDLARYPRTLDQDQALLESAGCQVIFAPTTQEMYPHPPQMRLHFGPVEEVMEGAFRPGHFSGVGVVVSRLFHIVQPTRAYFGQKDLQQVAVVGQLIQDLAFDLELVVCPTEREADGLAMSSRNRRISPELRPYAPFLYAQLLAGRQALEGGYPAEVVKAMIVEAFAARPEFQLEYVEVVDRYSMQPIEARQAVGGTAICLAAHLSGVRLIDNIVF